jgi:Mg2+ and Co2+ transporter CorA
LGGLFALLEEYSKAIDEQEAIIDDADTAKEIFDLIRHAGPLARSSRNLYHALVDAAVLLPKDKELRSARDRAHENERAADLLYADARVTLEFIRAERAEEQARSSDRLARLGFRLNLLAGFFLPLVALGGLMGMNVKLPEFVQNAFWLIFLGGLIFGVLILVLVGYKTGASRKEE